MNKRLIFRLLVIDIGIPVIAGISTWLILREPLNALVVALLFVTLTLVAQIYIGIHVSRVQELPFPAIRKLVNNVNKLWNHNYSNDLFQLLLADKMESVANEIGPMHFLGRHQEIQEKGILLAKQIKNGAFLTFLASFQDYWDIVSPYFEQIRVAASKMKKDITRIFICDSSALQNISLLKYISEDSRANIKTYIVLTENVAEKEVLKDFGIWDDKVLCLIEREATAGITVGCEYTTDETRLKMAQGWRERLMSYAQSPTVLLETMLRSEINETMRELQESAPLIEEWSRECSSTFLGGDSCRWFHGPWQYLRLLDLVASPDWHQQFYKDTLINILNRNLTPKILICGVADYGMLRHVFTSSKAVQAVPDITVIDMCETPLKACQWFARRHNFTIHTSCDNIITAKLGPSSFDLVITDEFLLVVGPSHKRDVVSKWKELLKPSGNMVTTLMLESNGNRRSRWETSKEQRDEYAERAWKMASERAALIWPKLAYREIEKMARDYATHMTNYTVNSEEEIKSLFTDFRILQINRKQIPGEFVCPGESFEIFAEKL